MKKICVITGSRAEYGLLSRLMKLIDADPDLTLQIIATNMHLSPEFALTYREIENDGFRIDKKVNMLISGDSANATAKSTGLALIGFADAYEDLKPDWIVVLGDRYEILAAVTTALFFQIPVAHISGGDVTEGAYDDAIRHSITKMSQLHFPSTDVYRQRVIQLGEQPCRVFNVGSTGIDNIKKEQLMNQEELEKKLNFKFNHPCVLVTFHPVTLENKSAEAQFKELLKVIEARPDLHVIFTMPNSDTQGRVLMDQIKTFVSENADRCAWFTSLGKLRYLSALQYVDAVLGNSSSGIIEVPSFHIPTLNIGDRQKGRLRSRSVTDCKPEAGDIGIKLDMLLKPEYRDTLRSMENPYEKADSAEQILHILKQHLDQVGIQKHFYDIKNDELSTTYHC